MKIIKELIPYIIIIIAIILIRAFIITPVRVDGNSMKNTFEDGDLLLLFKLGNVDRFDVVLLDQEYDDEILIKRIIGLPGETVEIKNGKIYINEEEISDDYGYGETSDYEKTTLSADEYFILGDNRLISKDSRYFGPVKEEEIMGKIILRFYPFNKINTF